METRDQKFEAKSTSFVNSAQLMLKLRTISWRLARGKRLRCYSMPSQWMQTAQRERLQAELEAILVQRLHAIPRYGVLAENGDPLSERYVSIIYRPDGTPHAFGTVKPILFGPTKNPLSVALLGLAAVANKNDPAYPLLLLYFFPLFWMFVRGGFRPFGMAVCTMHPAPVELITRYFSNVYPDYRIVNQPPPAKHAAIAQHLVQHHGKDFGFGADSTFDPEGFVLRNAYLGPCATLRRDFETLRMARDERCNAFCRASLDYARGDDLLLIGWFNWAAIWRSLSPLFGWSHP